jgi:hypothetical protein
MDSILWLFVLRARRAVDSFVVMKSIDLCNLLCRLPAKPEIVCNLIGAERLRHLRRG